MLAVHVLSAIALLAIPVFLTFPMFNGIMGVLSLVLAIGHVMAAAGAASPVVVPWFCLFGGVVLLFCGVKLNVVRPGLGYRGITVTRPTINRKAQVAKMLLLVVGPVGVVASILSFSGRA